MRVDPFAPQRKWARRALTSDENFFVGDPGTEPVKLGDTAVRKADLAAYVRYRAETAKT